ncbi:CoA transferase [Nocardia sp. NPDC059239]|uniref:CoA transferase n=1 Tax=unclassified Nocardia TaxID=2637762 RepID=UPI00369F640F
MSVPPPPTPCAHWTTPPSAFPDSRHRRQPSARIQNQRQLYALVAEWAAGRSADEAAKLLSDNDIPAAPLMSIADIAADPHYRDRGTLIDVDDPDHGRISMAAPLPRMSGTPGSIRSLGPALGSSTDDILAELLGLDTDTRSALRAEGII